MGTQTSQAQVDPLQPRDCPLTMTGPELRDALDALGMSQRAFAIRFGLFELSVSRWVNERRAVPSWVPPVLELLRNETAAKNGKI